MMWSLLNQLKQQNCSLWLEDGELELSYADVPPSQECIDALKANKSTLIDLLVEREVSSQAAFNQLEEWQRAPLSFAQQRLLFLERLMEGSDAYHMPTLVELDSTACLTSLEAALSELVGRHAALRTVFRTDTDGQDYQQVLKLAPVMNYTVVKDMTSFSEELRDAVTRPFDLDKELPLRLHRYMVGDKQYLLLNWHHIAFDGWSAGVFFNELSTCYQANLNSEEHSLPTPSLSYLDFARWQRDQKGREAMDADEAFWREQLAEYEPLQLPLDNERPTSVDYQGKDLEFVLDKALSDQLRELARQSDTTLYTVLLGGFFITLSQFSGQQDIVIGSPFDNRMSTQLHPIVGFFVNALPIRHKLAPAQQVSSLIHDLHQQLVAVKEHQSLPFDQLVNVVDDQRDLSRHPIYQVMFSVQRFGTEGVAVEGLPFQTVALSRYLEKPTPARFDISLFLDDSQPEILGSLNYASRLFESETMDNFRQMFQRVIRAMADNPQQVISGIDGLSPTLHHKMLETWNQTDASFPAEQCLHQLFEQQVARTPDASALAFANQVISYRQLNQQANRLAYALQSTYQREYGCPLPGGTLVAINVERDPNWVVAILAVLKAGGAYLPLLPSAPPQRNAFILQDAKPALMLVNQAQWEKWTDFEVSVPLVAIDDLDALPKASSRPLEPLSDASDLAYVIYTSGTTGEPKGVMVSHRNAVHLVSAQTEAFDATHCCSSLLFAAGVFDAHVSELFVALANGHLAVLADDDTRQDPEHLKTLCERWSVELATLPPSLLATLEPDDFPSFKVLVTAGETPSLSALQRFSSKCQVINAYGPTEITVCATAHHFTPESSANQIGSAINNTRLYVLDGMGRPVPIGTPGELYVGGAGVALGYLNRQDLTAERFVSNTFATAHDRQLGYDRLYRTGDRVKWLADGSLAFLGRNDTQVKIRGFRVELGEVEALIAEQPEVGQTAVIVADNDHQPSIAVYAVMLPQQNLTLEALNQRLSERLPAYMLPSSLNAIDQLPMTVNGKLDVAALPSPNRAAAQEYSAPENQIQHQLCEIWQQLLGAEQIGIEDNFFEVGGNSVLIVQLQQRIAKQLGVKVSVVQLFAHPNIASLSRFLLSQQSPNMSSAKQQNTSRSVMPSAPIAVIGMAGKFPKAGDVETFWQRIAEGYCAVDMLDDETLLERGADPAWLNQPNYVRSEIAIDDQAMFDAGFFGFNDRVAQLTDPQHRWMLECAVQALEHSGYPEEPDNQRIGVFVGKSEHFAWHDRVFSKLSQANMAGDMEAGQAIGKDFLATLLSYKLNLTGPSLNLATACSTSLVAVHEACQQIRAGHCEMAMAGGVSLDCEPSVGYLHQPGFIFSKDGYCRPFDIASSGTVRGYGAGMVVLKRLDKALADGDTVYGVVRGSAINNDGANKVSYSAPSVMGQVTAIQDACEDAGIDSATIQYVECHGTGTPLGDPIEISALSQAYQANTQAPLEEASCALGSLKANVGHLDSAAGVAGLIKTIQALRYGQLPPMANFSAPNPELELGTTPFYVNDRLRSWPESESPRRAGISSFGIGGTNAHLILEQPPEQSSKKNTQAQVLVLSAKTPTALASLRDEMGDYLVENPAISLGDVAYTLQKGRASYPYRDALACVNVADAASQLRNELQSAPAGSNKSRPVVFLFPGQGTQYAGMGHSLSRQSPLFKATLEHGVELLRKNHQLDLSPWLIIPTHLEGQRDDSPQYLEWRKQADEMLRRTENTQPALFCIEYALATYWMSLGLKPVAMIGHSLGEYVAACIAGVFTLEGALELVVTRARMMQQLEAGDMVSVNSEQSLANELAERFELSIAAHNGQQQYVLSGEPSRIKAMRDWLELQGVRHKALTTSHAFHSNMMEPILARFHQEVSKHEMKAPTIPYLSNLSGGWIDAGDACSADYWVSHLRQGVKFYDGVETIIEQFCDEDTSSAPVFIEMGPGRTLSGMVASIHPPLNDLMVASIPAVHGGNERELGTLEAIAACWRMGVRIDWSSLHSGTARRRIALPTYPFEHQSYWLEKVPAKSTIGTLVRNDIEQWFYKPTWQLSAPAKNQRHCHNVLILGDDTAITEPLSFQLQGQGVRVYRAESGASYAQYDASNFSVRPDSSDDYDRLFAALKTADTMPDTIVHLWQYGQHREQPCLDLLTASQAKGFDCAIVLAQSLGRNHAETEVVFVTSHQQAVLEQDIGNPLKATLLGACKIIDVEYDGISTRSIDFAPGSESESTERHVLSVAKELATPATDIAVAYRQGLRFTPSFEPVQLLASSDLAKPFKPGGTYLIAGGLGGMGLAFAQHISSQVSANLILLTRREFPQPAEWPDRLQMDDETADHIRLINQLEEKGSRVIVASADLEDFDAMANIVTQVREQFGKVDGWIHAAGIVDDTGVIQRNSKEALERSMRAKVRGTLVLDQLLAPDDPDFIFFCSSLSVSTHRIKYGQVGYAAANEFLDAYASYKKRTSNSVVTVVDWDDWRDVGMSKRTRDKANYTMSEEEASTTLTVAEGQTIFSRALSSGLERIMVSIREFSLWQRTVVEMSNGGLQQDSHVDDVELPLETMTTEEIEMALSALLKRMLGVKEINPGDDFFQLGGDSLLVIQLVNAIRDQFGITLGLEDIMTRPVLAEIQALVIEKIEWADDDEFWDEWETSEGFEQEGTI